MGATQYFVIVNSCLLDLMNENELIYVFGHELGHVKCNHVLYQQVFAVEAEGAMTLGLTIPGRLES